ncbi:schlafen family member 5-like [Xenia sp. Carnegie-2017]|uniref:schlafen family member 5-like n=1 Tax=Xenia sp. Carnegie-2017 TaxID=2897299 RepID=UPI001F03F1B0|nr:schlafen family member 5-like [Xenia sp. Carnegie-2017]
MQKSRQGKAVILRCTASKLSKHIVVSSVCALLNTNGGQFVIQCDGNAVGDEEIEKKIKIVEQWIEELLGKMFMLVKIKFNVSLQEICISVEKFHDLVTVDYKMFLPSPSQIYKISGQSLVLAREAVFAKNSSTTTRYDLPVVQESFIYGSKICMFESYEVQFKRFKRESTNSTSLADRLVGNKLLETISAFANYRGGAIYVGVNDDSREIHGERVTAKEKKNIAEHVTEKIHEMVWFSLQMKPSRGVHWDIYFRGVVDENSKLMESTYVIVIVVAHCAGGVSVGEPESYHIVNDVVKRMDLVTWTERFFRKDSFSYFPTSGIDRTNWSSERNRDLFHHVNGLLIRSINSGSWDEFWVEKEKLEVENSNCKMIKLVVISNEITAHYKLGRFDRVKDGIKDYESLLSKSTVDANINEARLYLLKSCIQRCRGNIKNSYEEANKGLAIVDRLPRGIVVGEYFAVLLP